MKGTIKLSNAALVEAMQQYINKTFAEPAPSVLSVEQARDGNYTSAALEVVVTLKGEEQ